MKKQNKHTYSPDKFFEKLLKNPEVRKKYEEERLKDKIAMEVKNLRKKNGLTQVALAEKIGSKQSAIARLESGKGDTIPTIPLLSKIAVSCNSEFDFRFKNKRKVKT